MEQEKHYRHELKYVIPYAEYLAVRQRLRTVMAVDPHVSKSGLYQTRSAYFDNTSFTEDRNNKIQFESEDRNVGPLIYYGKKNINRV